MKRKPIILIVVLPIIAAIIIGLFVWKGGVYEDLSSIAYYDQLAASATKDNPFGLEARVIYFRDSAISCPSSPCGPFPGWALKLVSDKPAWLLGYAVCDGQTSCKAEQTGGVIASAETSGLEDKTDLRLWSGYVIRWVGQQDGGRLPWKVGDDVHVLVKVQPATMEEKDNIRQWRPAVVSINANINNSESQQIQAIVTDLGELKITEVPFGP